MSERLIHLAHQEYTPSPFNCTEYHVDVNAGIVEEFPKRSKVCIMGAGYGAKEAPLEDASWSVWALNAVGPRDSQNRLRADRWFELHQRIAQSADDMIWVEKCPMPIYVPPDMMEYTPMAIRFPLERVEHTFQSPYWSCTFAYQIALAMMEGFTDIGLFGVELAYGTPRERTVEWACVSWWMGYAEAKGVTFYLPEQSRLGRHPHRYGIDYMAEKRGTDVYIEMMEEMDRARADQQGMGG